MKARELAKRVNRGGRPRAEPDRYPCGKIRERSRKPEESEQEILATVIAYRTKLGIPEKDIACVLDIDPKTLRKHYRHELDFGHAKANAKVAENLFRKATGEGRESVTAAIFWLKTRARWKETMVNEVTHEPGDALKVLMARIAETGRRLHGGD